MGVLLHGGSCACASTTCLEVDHKNVMSTSQGAKFVGLRWFHGVVVITFALHAKGHEFETRWDQIYAHTRQLAAIHDERKVVDQKSLNSAYHNPFLLRLYVSQAQGRR